MTKRLILVHGDKGGVGKSVFARGLTDYFVRRGIAADFYDSDKRNPDLARFYAKTAGVQLVDLTQKTAFDAVLDRLSSSGSRALVDLAAGAGEALNDLVTGEIQLGEALNDLGARATVIYVLSRSRSSLAALSAALKDFESVPADWLIVKNVYFGGPEKFSRFDSSKARSTARERGAIELEMPELLDDLYDELDMASRPFADAIANGDLTFTNRRRLKGWIEKLDTEIEKASAVL